MNRKIFLFIIITLSLLAFFGLSIISDSSLDYFFLLTIFLLTFPKFHGKNTYSTYVLLYAFFVLLSCLYSWRYNGQGIIKLIGHSYDYIAVIFIFVIEKYKLTSKEVITVLEKCAIFFCICYILQWLIYPEILFSGAEDENAITVNQFRLRMPGSILCYFLLIYAINNYILTKQIKNVGYAIIAFFPILMQGFRSLLALTILASILIIPFVLRSFKKSLIYFFLGFIVLLASIGTSLVQSKIEEMNERQERNESFDNDDYIRFLSFNYYYNQQFIKPYETIIGGGIPADDKSSYFKQISYAADNFGFYWIDLGVVGLSMIIGVPAVLMLIVMYILCMWRCKEPQIQFVRFTLFIVLLGSIFTSMELYRKGNLLLLSYFLYLEYIYHKEIRISKCKKAK